MKKLLQKLPSAGAGPLRIRKILEWGCACGLLLTIVLTATAVRYQTVCARVCGDTLRLHILANSDTVEDQLLKLQVRDAVLEQVTAATQYAETKQQAVQTLRTAMPDLQRTAQRTLRHAGSSQQVQCRLEEIPFAARRYSGLLAAGGYLHGAADRTGQRPGAQLVLCAVPGALRGQQRSQVCGYGRKRAGIWRLSGAVCSVGYRPQRVAENNGLTKWRQGVQEEALQKKEEHHADLNPWPFGQRKIGAPREELRQRARSRQRSILIVPEQFTSSTEGALYHALGDELSAYVESYSFTSLAETLLRRYGGAAVPTLSEAGRAVLVRRAMDEMMDKVVYYSRQRRSAAFCQKAAETISELKSAGIRPETLADYANAPGADKDKLGELALIFGTYETLLAQTAMDPGDRVELGGQKPGPGLFCGPHGVH